MRLPFSAQAAAQAVPATLLAAALALAPSPQVVFSAPHAVLVPAASAEEPPAKAAMSKKDVENRLAAIPVIALVNQDDSPFFTGRDGLNPLAFFYLEPNDALRELSRLQQETEITYVLVCN